MTGAPPGPEKRARQVLGLEDFTAADLEAIHAAEPPPESAENDKGCAFDATLAEMRALFADMPTEELQAIIDAAAAALRERRKP